MRRDILMASNSAGDILPLIGGIINQALADYKGTNVDERDDAIRFLLSEDFKFLCNLEPIDLMNKVDGLKRYNDYIKRKKEEKCSKDSKVKAKNRKKCSSSSKAV